MLAGINYEQGHRGLWNWLAELPWREVEVEGEEEEVDE